MVTNTATIEHSSITPVDVSAVTMIEAAVFEVYLPVVLND
jgi:hypothetical protein